jgi:hypothetical protein
MVDPLYYERNAARGATIYSITSSARMSQVRRDFKTERPSASQIDHQIEPSRQHERQLTNLFPF